jgi:hypothetical protein
LQQFRVHEPFTEAAKRLGFDLAFDWQMYDTCCCCAAAEMAEDGSPTSDLVFEVELLAKRQRG